MIPAGHITAVDSAVHVAFGESLPVNRLAAWVDEQVICRIPGATDAPE
jgi:hypothetical protein